MTIVQNITIILSLYMHLLFCLPFLFHYDFDHIKCHFFQSYCYTCTHIFHSPMYWTLSKHVLLMLVDMVSYRVTLGLFYNKISMICLRKARKVPMCLSVCIDTCLLCLRHVMSWCLVIYKSNLLLFSLLIVCGDIELYPSPDGTPVSHENTLAIVHANIRSLRNKLNYVIDIVEDFDIIFFYGSIFR